VLSRGKVTPATVSYYTDEVAPGLEDYYAGRGEAVGHWVGHGSSAAGLSGEVSPDQLARLFQAVHPETGEALGAAYTVRAGADRVTGCETFSAPKSLSVLWALGGSEVGMAAKEAHDAAVAAGIRQVDSLAVSAAAAGVLEFEAGIASETIAKLIFEHRPSGGPEPSLADSPG
jgi:conjugative relaxase-like TrwC/TraI family protein